MSPIQNWGKFARFSEMSGDNFNHENGIDRATVIFFIKTEVSAHYRQCVFGCFNKPNPSWQERF